MTSPDRLVFADCETTGTNPDEDRIVEIGLAWRAGEKTPTFSSLVNPGIPIPPETTEIHGITDEMVKDAPRFEEIAAQVQQLVDGAILVSYNGRRFDTPLIDAELRRAGQPGLSRDKVGRIVVPEIDVLAVWREKEKRSLEAAVQRFAGVAHDRAHEAVGDIAVLPAVLQGMGVEFEFDPTDTETLVKVSCPEDVIDRDGKFRKQDGRVVFNFGKHKDKDVRWFLDYLKWMIEPERDFSRETTAVAQYLYDRYRAQLTVPDEDGDAAESGGPEETQPKEG